MKIRIRWETEEYGEMGRAEVIEACCDTDLNYNKNISFDFNVEKEDGVLHAFLCRGWDDGYAVPMRFCPSCGATVEVVEEILYSALI